MTLTPFGITQIEHFYREFPKFFDSERFEATVSRTDEYRPFLDFSPITWKTIGDEILFCCRVLHLEHLACATGAFLDALDGYGKYLDGVGKRLDVKGAGWIAAFPVPNITVKITEDSDAADIQIDEEFEKRADETPSEFDFFGKGN